MTTHHPRRDGAGRKVLIRKPSKASKASAWGDPMATVVVVPDGLVPTELHGIPFEPWSPPDRAWWEAAAGSAAVAEPPFVCPAHLQPAAGVVVIEPDGRIWLAQPTNRFGGAGHVVPKGRVDGRAPAAAAMREAWEEVGLLVRLDAHLIDLARTTTFVRFYVGRRVDGSPGCMGWESQGVVLCPLLRLPVLLDGPHDMALVDEVIARLGMAKYTQRLNADDRPLSVRTSRNE